MFVAQYHLREQWLHGRIIANERHMTKTASVWSFCFYQHRQSLVSFRQDQAFFDVICTSDVGLVHVHPENFFPGRCCFCFQSVPPPPAGDRLVKKNGFCTCAGCENVGLISGPENRLRFLYQHIQRADFGARFLGPKSGPFFGSKNRKKTQPETVQAWLRSSFSSRPCCFVKLP